MSDLYNFNENQKNYPSNRDYNRAYGIGDDLEDTKYFGNPSYDSSRLGRITMSPRELENFRNEELQRLKNKDRYQGQLNQMREERSLDLQAGKDFFQSLYNSGEGAIGKTAFGNVRQERSGDLADILQRRRDALGGLDSTEGNALREASLRGLTSQQQSSARNLRGSLGNLRGGAAAAAQADLANQGQNQRAQMEQDLLLQNVNIRNQALNDFEGTLSRAEQDELSRQQYNQAQAAREMSARGGAQLGFANLGQAERNQLFGQINAENQADATRASGGGGGMCFITTAVCDYLGIPDDENNTILNVFRKFRDEHMGGKESDLVKEYYRIAPLMKDQLECDYKELHNIAVTEIIPAYYCIRTDQPEDAKNIYLGMVTRLAGKYEIGLEL